MNFTTESCDLDAATGHILGALKALVQKSQSAYRSALEVWKVRETCLSSLADPPDDV